MWRKAGRIDHRYEARSAVSSDGPFPVFDASLQVLDRLHIQGWLFCRPLPPEALETFLRDGRYGDVDLLHLQLKDRASHLNP